MGLKSRFITALLTEISLRSASGDTEVSIIETGTEIETIYFGGGTPSLLTLPELETILSAIKTAYKISPAAEITLEANADDIMPQKLQEWKKAGINRLSIGVQSFHQRDLEWMNRAHDARQAQKSIALAREAGIPNFSIDLIFGTPGLTTTDWEQNLQMAIDLKIPHIAAYALTVEPKTALAKMIALKKKENIDPDEQAQQFMQAMNKLQLAGYEHYEISNFALPGYRSRHNSSYWQGKKYIGFGPSAHSYNGEKRMWNVANNVTYIKSLAENNVLFETEQLTDTEKVNEYIMISLRTMEGVDLAVIEKRFSQRTKAIIEKNMSVDLSKGNLTLKGEHITLTEQGKLLADAISVRLFL